MVQIAALHAPHVGIYDDSEFFRINIEGTKNVFRAAVDCGVQALVFTSTTALYGYAAQRQDSATWINEETIPEPVPIMAMYRLHRGIDARDVGEGHRLALVKPKENYRMFFLSGATPFARSDCKVLKQTPENVLRHKCPSICDLFTSRQWRLPESIDRIYDSSLAQRALGWIPSYGVEEVIRLLDAHIPEVLPAQAAENTISE